MRPNVSFNDFYDEYPRIEGAFQAALDESLSPRGPEFLFEIVVKLGLPPGANVLDLGCGEGRQSIKLAEDFGFAVQGIDLVPRQIELAGEELGRAVKRKPELSGLVRFRPGSAEEIPLPDASVDLIWCREMLMHVEALDKAFAECRRVLRDGGRMLIYQVFSITPEVASVTDRLAPTGPGWYAENVEAAFTGAGFQIDECIELASEGGERAQEESGEPGRRLLHTARLLRQPDRYITKFGRTAYDIMLGDCLWHVYRMIGKLSARVYLLKTSQTSEEN